MARRNFRIRRKAPGVGVDIELGDADMLDAVGAANRFAFREVGKVLVREMETRCPVGAGYNLAEWAEQNLTGRLRSLARRQIKKGFLKSRGRLKRSIKILTATRTRLRVGSRVFYARFVELGTAAHDIVVGKRKAIPTIIRHPGARKKPFMRPALDSIRGAWPTIFRLGLARYWNPTYRARRGRLIRSRR